MNFLKKFKKYNLEKEANLLFNSISFFKGVYKKNTVIDYKNGFNSGIYYALISREPQKKTKLKYKKFNIKSKKCREDGFDSGYVATFQELDFWFNLKNKE